MKYKTITCALQVKDKIIVKEATEKERTEDQRRFNSSRVQPVELR